MNTRTINKRTASLMISAVLHAASCRSIFDVTDLGKHNSVLLLLPKTGDWQKAVESLKMLGFNIRAEEAISPESSSIFVYVNTFID